MNASLSDLQPVLAKQGSRFYRSRPFESMLPWLVLLLLLGLTFANFFLFPYAGFDFTYDEVVFVYSATPPGDHLEIGDRLIHDRQMGVHPRQSRHPVLTDPADGQDHRGRVLDGVPVPVTEPCPRDVHAGRAL